MTAGGIVSLKFVIDLRRGLERLFQTVSPYQRRRAVHFVEVLDFPGNRDEAVVVIEFLPNELVTENGA